MNRAERRRQEREAKKETQKSINAAAQGKKNVSNMSIQEAAKLANVRVELIQDYLDAREDEMLAHARELLGKAEDYIAVANLLASCYAIHNTWGYTLSIQRFLENFNDAMDQVDSMGAVGAYEEAHKNWKIEIGFDDIDINKEFRFHGPGGIDDEE